ncbi:Proteins of 100 residues with WXG [Sinosporangium album]|uniref:Proteins of 100 residues with WXG n=1 Tax=Sinosporangium album TaxID=504805 RepID=A0A1G7YX42_9ACTN|nr:WXG100 family type VII secretion target [Sinosporangium album]SDH01041.1 Proteins of 100 residues with WXG [Sinosporangium album]
MPLDDYTRVHFGNMELRQQELAKLVGLFETAFDDMVKELRVALGDDGNSATDDNWSGAAAVYFNQMKVRWHQQASQMRNELNQAQLTVGIARDNYQHAEKLNAGMWTRDA